MDDFSINNIHREKSEPCMIKQENKVNSTILQYITENEKVNTATVIDNAMKNPTVLYVDGHVAPNGIEDATSLRFGKLTNINEIQSLHVRTNTQFNDGVNPLLDMQVNTQLRNGTTFLTSKPELMVAQPDVFMPQIDSLKKSVQNPINIIPELSASNFSRIGINTRLNKKKINKN
tara:strand:+ start:477 stop:1001 length:525 start_codon:yes stop_codon:yes gene_type:complete